MKRPQGPQVYSLLIFHQPFILFGLFPRTHYLLQSVLIEQPRVVHTQILLLNVVTDDPRLGIVICLLPQFVVQIHHTALDLI